MWKLLVAFFVAMGVSLAATPALADEQPTCLFSSAEEWLENGRTDGVPNNRAAMRARLTEINSANPQQAAAVFAPQIMANAAMHPCEPLVRQVTPEMILRVAGVTAAPAPAATAAPAPEAERQLAQREATLDAVETRIEAIETQSAPPTDMQREELTELRTMQSRLATQVAGLRQQLGRVSRVANAANARSQANAVRITDLNEQLFGPQGYLTEGSPNQVASRADLDAYVSVEQLCASDASHSFCPTVASEEVAQSGLLDWFAEWWWAVGLGVLGLIAFVAWFRSR